MCVPTWSLLSLLLVVRCSGPATRHQAPPALDTRSIPLPQTHRSPAPQRHHTREKRAARFTRRTSPFALPVCSCARRAARRAPPPAGNTVHCHMRSRGGARRTLPPPSRLPPAPPPLCPAPLPLRGDARLSGAGVGVRSVAAFALPSRQRCRAVQACGAYSMCGERGKELPLPLTKQVAIGGGSNSISLWLARGLQRRGDVVHGTAGRQEMFGQSSSLARQEELPPVTASSSSGALHVRARRLH